MDYEKAYKAMVQRARELHEGGNALTKQQMEIVCPELAESGDERIRKAIYDFISKHFIWNDEKALQTRREMLDYLEKQKEQKPKFYPGNVLKCTSTGSLWVRCKGGDNIKSDGHTACIGGGFELASEEEAAQFFQELTENGYYWDCIKGRPIKKEQRPIECSKKNKDKPISTILIDALKGNAQLEWELKRAGVDVKRLVTYLEQKEQTPKEDKDAIEPTPKQDYSGLTDFERAIHRGFLCAGVENVPVEIIKETARDCLAHIEQKSAEWNLPEDFEEAVYKVANYISPFDSQDEFRRVSHRFAEQLMSLAKKELVEKPAEWSESEKSHQWKPSEEQMEALKWSLEILNFGTLARRGAMESLYAQLDKLM